MQFWDYAFKFEIIGENIFIIHTKIAITCQEDCIILFISYENKFYNFNFF